MPDANPDSLTRMALFISPSRNFVSSCGGVSVNQPQAKSINGNLFSPSFGGMLLELLGTFVI